MSHSSQPREPSSIPSPRPLQAKPASNPTAASRPGTASTSNVESLKSYASIPPFGISDPSRQQPDLSQIPSESAAQPQPRGFRVHSILNPSPETRQQPSIGASRPSAAGAAQTLLPPPTVSPRSRKRAEPASPTRSQHVPASAASGRRVLTPKSPSHRAASLGGRRNLTFHATHAQPQSLTAPEHRIYTVQPGSADVPFLSPLTATTQAAELWPNQGRPQPGPGAPGPGASSIATTQTASPSTSHTSQSQTEQTSPAFRYGAMPTPQQPFGSLRQQPPGPTVGYPADPGLRGHPESYQAGQPAYQIMLETDQGPIVVPVELDLQQASKMADEKRKRNAEASARFRARRSEKEKEASQTISTLEQELQELREERDFYRNERNYIRDFATRHVGVQLPPRPPSPQVQCCAARVNP